jgi:threonine dehydrogenase-like Zn-dependent dehydrogenase
MKAFLYHGPGSRSWEDVADSKIEVPTDIVIQVDAATICGTDLDTTGLVDTCTTPRLMQLVAAGKLDPTVFATHRFSLDEAMRAYDAFVDAKSSGAFKVVLEGVKHQQPGPADEAVVPAGVGEEGGPR